MEKLYFYFKSGNQYVNLYSPDEQEIAQINPIPQIKSTDHCLLNLRVFS